MSSRNKKPRFKIVATRYDEITHNVQLLDIQNNELFTVKALEILKYDHFLTELSPDDLRRLIYGVHHDLMILEKKEMSEARRQNLFNS